MAVKMVSAGQRVALMPRLSWCRLAALPEVLDLALRSERAGRAVGVYIETKDPTFHARIGLPLEERLVQALVKAGYRDIVAAPVILQSFEEPVRVSPSKSTAQPYLLHCTVTHPDVLAEGPMQE